MPLNFLAQRRRTLLRGGGNFRRPSPIRSGFTPSTPDPRMGIQPINSGVTEKQGFMPAMPMEEMHYGVQPLNPGMRKEKVMAGVPSGIASPGMLR